MHKNKKNRLKKVENKIFKKRIFIEIVIIKRRVNGTALGTVSGKENG
jgi:hypothetical protein